MEYHPRVWRRSRIWLWQTRVSRRTCLVPMLGWVLSCVQAFGYYRGAGSIQAACKAKSTHSIYPSLIIPNTAWFQLGRQVILSLKPSDPVGSCMSVCSFPILKGHTTLFPWMRIYHLIRKPIVGYNLWGAILLSSRAGLRIFNGPFLTSQSELQPIVK